ncbi:MAG TPA: zinc ribbon domain-containing protein [Candidatus Deferrimicrobium sp.]|nr:zinc ribbon domain-containing protein [Candidatus Deferrimicrobium sp.]
MDKIEGEFICRKCQSPLSIYRILVSKKGYALLEVACQNKHSGKRKFEMQQQNEWMPTTIKHLYICPRCSADLTDLRQKTDGDLTVLLLNCPTHGKIKKVISTSFFYAMDALRKQLTARPAYPAGYPAAYPPAAPYPSTYPPQPYPAQAPPPTGFPQPPPGQYPPTSSPPPATVSPPQFEVAPPIPPSTPPASVASPERTTGGPDLCPVCGEEITPGAMFCTSCGSELK